MIYAPGLIPAGVNDRLVSQIDLAPTLLGLLGVSYTSRFLGQDIYRTRLGQERILSVPTRVSAISKTIIS